MSQSLHTVPDDPSRDAQQLPVWRARMVDERSFRIHQKAVLGAQIAVHAPLVLDEATSGVGTPAEAVGKPRLNALPSVLRPVPSPARFGVTAHGFHRPLPDPGRSRLRHLGDADKPNRAMVTHRIPVTAWTR